MSPIIVAHRGASGAAPENTIAAFDEAHRQGATMIELDVQETKDGEIVVFHDDQLGRCTNIEEIYPERKADSIFQFNWSELQGLDASRSKSDFAASNSTKIPSLSEVLEWLKKHPKMSLNIELKSLPRLYKNLVSASVQLVNDYQLKDRILFSSFNHQDLLTVKEIDRTQRTAVLSSEMMSNLPKYARETIGADAINPGAYLLGLQSSDGDLTSGRELMAQAKKYQVESYVWTVNIESAFPILVELGVTGIITDFPARARQGLVG